MANTSEAVKVKVKVKVEEEEAAATVLSNGEAKANEEDNNADANKEADQSHDNSNPPPSHPSIEGASPGKIFVGGLPKETTNETFTKHFGKYGEITDSVIMKHRGTGHPRGFGFITYKDPSVVDVVILDTHIIDGKQVEIKRTIPKGAISGKDFKTKKIFIGGIPTTVSDDEFKNFFAKFGEVEEHQIMRDRSSGRSRGFGFISFNSERAVDDLLTKGNKIDFAGVQVEIKKAEPKKPTNAPAPPPTKHFSNPRPAFGRGFKDSYGYVGGGAVDAGSYRYSGGFESRPRGYGGYGGSEFDGGNGGYGSTGIGSYRGETSLGFSGRYGGGFGRGYDLGDYDGPSEGYGRYGGGGGYGSGYDSGPGVSYGGVGGYGGSAAGLYGTRRDYGGGAGGRYHPYAR